MNRSDQLTENSYVACRRMARQANSNFWAAFALLPPNKRRAMEALYAFMRYTDDLVDSPAKEKSVAEGRRSGDGDPRHDVLKRWHVSVKRSLQSAAESSDVVEYFIEETHDSTQAEGLILLPALADTVARFHIPVEHLYAVIDGVEMDLTKDRYENIEELQQYCRLVASAVGMACIHVWGFTDDRAIEPAVKCGIAFQLTNILRDMREDVRQGRVYLPLEDMRRCDYTIDDLCDGVADQRFMQLMALEIDRAECLYREAYPLLNWLHPDGRRICSAIINIYHALLRKIARHPEKVLKQHVRLNRMEKLWIAARFSIFGRQRKGKTP